MERLKFLPTLLPGIVIGVLIQRHLMPPAASWQPEPASCCCSIEASELTPIPMQQPRSILHQAAKPKVCPCGAACECSQLPLKIHGKVTQFLDADTCKVLVTVRLKHVDAPENDQPYGPEATAKAKEHALNKQVTVLGEQPDRYGRMIGEILLPEYGSLNRGLVREGYCHWYSDYSSDLTYRADQDRAKENRLGLWADREPIPPWQWRKSGAGSQQ
jgi:endonuclease YncB( thermonuclease family)